MVVVVTDGPDWIGAAVHWRDGRLVVLQLQEPRGDVTVETEMIDIGTFAEPDRTMPGLTRATIRVQGIVDEHQWTAGRLRPSGLVLPVWELPR